MTATTRPTLKSTNLRIDSIEHKLDAIIAALDPKQPAKVTPRKKAAPKAPVAKKAPAKRTTRKVTRKPAAKKAVTLTKASRGAFVRAAVKDGHTSLAGMSTQQVAHYAVTNGYAPKGFVVGAGYTAMFS